MVNINRDLTKVNASNPDDVNIVKRRTIEFLPAIFKTDVLKKFFASSVDHAYQPQISDELSGYIGEITSYYDDTRDFYLSEPNDTRKNYQLTPIMVSKNLKSNELKKQLYYDDLINYIRFKGGNVENHNRLFEQEYYSWLPPIDIDKFMNFRDYFWIAKGPESITVSDPINIASLTGLEQASITVNGENLQLSSGMKLLILNDAEIINNNKEFIVEGVGRSIIFVEDDTVVSGWDLEEWDLTLWDEIGNVFLTPDYITMERGCQDQNAWSLSNRWFHRDVIVNFFSEEYTKIQASRPIIEFERDLELWGFGTINRGTVDLVINNCDSFYNIIQGLNPGWAAQPWSLEDLGCGITINGWDGIWPLQNIGFTEIFVEDEFGTPVQLRDGLRILLTNDNDPGANKRIVEITGVQVNGSILLQFINNGADPLGNPVFGENVLFKSPSGLTKVYYYNGVDWVSGQTKTRTNQAPKFMLYDSEANRLNDTGIYPNSNFDELEGNEIFEYNIDEDISRPIDTVLGLRISRNQFDEITFKNTLVNKRFSFRTSTLDPLSEITGYYFYKTNNSDVDKIKYSNNWHIVPEKSKQFYIQRFNTKINQIEYPLDILPSQPYTKRNSVLKESIIVELNGRELLFNVDYTINEAAKALVLNTSTDANQTLIVRLLSDETPINGSGSYSIPLNLQANADNEEINIAGYNQLFEHFYTNIGGQPNLEGSQFSRNNYRDTKKLKYFGEKILQHTAPLLKTMLLASDSNVDFINSVKYSQREYVRFKNKFIQKITNFYNTGLLDVDSNTASEWVETALSEINVAKNDEFPFKNTGVAENSDLLSNRTFIPPTPAYLGITSVFNPEIYIDETFNTPVSFIQGHDGSLTPTFDDFRDEVMLELEKRIFNSIPEKFKSDNLPNLSKYEILPGKFRDASYSRIEILKIAQANFEIWSGQAGADYRTNNGTTENEFGLNYRLVKDRDGEDLPGSFRGIYIWYYDTDRPHKTPWEMLGFSIKPDWWDFEYGVAPYTSDNTKLWMDLEEGRIRQGVRAGFDQKFARPGLSNYIPVSTIGELLTPNQIGIISRFPTNTEALTDWIFGDLGPVETAWYKSEFYNFDLLQALFLLNPNKVIEFNWNNNEVSKVYQNFNSVTDEQLIYETYKLRPRNRNLIVHDETSEIGKEFANDDLTYFNGLFRSFGIQQYISNFLESQGKNITENFGDNIRGLGVQLAHKAAGFIDQNNLRLDSDSFGRVPSENVEISLLKSNSTKEVFYGGIIVEKTNKGYKVYGYDLINPVFNIIPGDELGPKTTIGIGNKGNPFENWNVRTNYVRKDIVLLESTNTFYRCIQDHNSTLVFQAEFWQRINRPPTQYQLTVNKFLTPIQGEPVVTVQYGTEYTTIQQVFNLFIDYERFLEKEGFIFDNITNEANDTLNWTWSGKEFMSWTLGSPQPGDIIAVSPASQKVKFKTDFGQVEPIEQIIRGVYSIVNRDGVNINPRNTFVTRLEGEVEIVPIDNTNPDLLIFSTRLYLTEIEHSIIIDNTTIFNDIVYDPLFNIRQRRLNMIALRAGNWTGRYDAPGFIISENNLLPNYDKLADQFRFIFDINKTNLVEQRWRAYGYHNIGYQNRDYLDQLIISEKSQLNFYQGMIGEKGTRSSFNRLLRSEFVTRTSDLFFYEEWAFRVGQYGDYDKKPGLEVLFPQDNFKQNPQRLDFELVTIPSFVPQGDSLPTIKDISSDYFFVTSEKQLYIWSNVEYIKTYNWDTIISQAYPTNSLDDTTTIYTITDVNGVIVGGDSKWLRRPDTTVSILDGWIWNRRSSEYGNLKDLPNAGYARIDEATYYAFDANALLNLHNQERQTNIGFVDGEMVWTYNTQGLYGYDVSGRGITKYPDSWSMFRISELVDVLPTDISISENRESLIITFNNFISLFDENGDLIVSATAIIPDEILDKTIFSNNIPTAGVVTTSSVSNSFFVTTSAGYAVSARTRNTITNNLMSEPIQDSIFSAYSFPVVIPSAGITTTTTSSTTYYVTSSSFVTVSVVDQEIISTEVSTVPVSVNFSAFINQENCPFSPAFEDNIFVVGAPEPGGIPVPPIGPETPTGNVPVPPKSFNIIDVNDIITIQSNEATPLGYEGSYVVREIISPNQIRVDRPLSVELDINEDDFTDDVTIFKTFIFKETRFKNTDEFNSITGSIIYRNNFFNDFNNIFYIDDSRTTNEKNLLEPYYTVNNTVDWNGKEFNVLRRQENKVDNATIFNGLIYDRIRNQTILGLSLYDPYKGVIPGTADNEIWYKLDFDPAKYTTGNSLFHQIDVDKAWGREQVGRTWWDLSTLRYLDYEISDNNYRRENWGKLAPGSSVDVYEWVRSSIPPLEYQIQANQNNSIPANTVSTVPSGEIFSSVSPAYSQFREYDEKTKSLKTFYYFWVRNKSTLPNVGFRKISVLSVANIIRNPTSSGINWFAPININSLVVGNVFEFLASDNTILQINWRLDEKNRGNWHKQWVLGRDGDPSWRPEELVYNKMVDSLVGYNTIGEIVPNPTLNDYERYGIFYRPRQTMFVNKTRARSNIIEYFNYLLEQTPYNERLNALENILVEDFPTIETNHVVDNFAQRDFIAQSNVVALGETVLVNQNPELNEFWSIWKLVTRVPLVWELVVAQSFKTSDFVNIVDWYSLEVDKNNPPIKIYNNIDSRNSAFNSDLIEIGDLFKVEDVNNSGIWEWQVYEGLNEEQLPIFRPVARKGATIGLSSKFITNEEVYGINTIWSSLSQSELFDKISNRDGSLELRVLFNIFRFEENNLTIEEINRIFFKGIEYAHSENQIIDWAFKSSYILFGGTTESLSQEEILRPSLFESLVSYISEIKPYHVKFREFARRIATTIDTYETGITDFDLPPYFDRELNKYRILDINNPTDEAIISSTLPWKNWYENHLTNPALIRNFSISQKFDRVSCSTSDTDPLLIKIFANGVSNIYDLIIDNQTIVTTPVVNDYSPYIVNGVIGLETFNNITIMVDMTFDLPTIAITDETVVVFINNIIITQDVDYIVDIGLQEIKFLSAYVDVKLDIRVNSILPDGPQIWTPENINRVFIQNNNTATVRLLTTDQWQIIPIILDENLPTERKSLRLILDTIPAQNEIIEIERKVFAADRINRFYQPITNLITGKPVNELLPSKNSPGLISGCVYDGTSVEGGNYILTAEAFQQVQDNYLSHIWDIRPNLEFVTNQLIDLYNKLKTTNLTVETFDSSSLIWNLDTVNKFNKLFKQTYSWDNQPWDGASGSNSVEFPTYISAVQALYDVILSGVSTPVSGITWQGILSPLDSIVDGNEFVQPYLGPNRPEELTLLRIPDPLLIDVYSQDSVGAPKIYQFRINTKIASGDVWALPGLAQSREAIFVYVDGRLLTENTEYVINWNQQTLTFLITLTTVKVPLEITTYSIGGLDQLHYTKYFKASSAIVGNNIFLIDVDREIIDFMQPENIFATVDGYITPVTAVNSNGLISLDTNGVFITPNTSVIFNIFNGENIAKVRRQNIFIVSGQTDYEMLHPSGPEEPREQSTLIFRNGFRQFGPIFKYFTGNSQITMYNTGLSLNEYNDITVLVDGLPNINWSINADDPSVIDFFNTVTSGVPIVVRINDNSSFSLKNLSTGFFDADDFDIDDFDLNPNQSGVAIRFNNIPANSVVSVITFNENSSIKLRTEFFKGRKDSSYDLAFIPTTELGIWAAVSGNNSSYILDYELDVRKDNEQTFFYNESIIPFVSGIAIWDIAQGLENIDVAKIRFKDKHLIDSNEKSIADFSTVGFDSNAWEAAPNVPLVSGNSFTWDDEQPTITTVVNVPGFDNAEENEFDVIGFDQPNLNVIQKNVYISYMTGFEKTESVSFRTFKSTNNTTEYIRIADSHKMFLTSVVSANSTSLNVSENIELLPALINSKPLMTPNISENIPGVIWINGERIQYWNLSEPTIVSGNRIWTISNLQRGTNQTSSGIIEDAEYFEFNGNGIDTEFVVNADLSAGNTIVQLFNFVSSPGPWVDSNVSRRWDTFGWDVTSSRNTDIPQQLKISISAEGDYSIDNNAIIFEVPPPSDPLSLNVLVETSGGFVEQQIPLPNILVTKINSNWNNNTINHQIGSVVINGSETQKIPGGYNPLYNKPDNLGLQNQLSVQTEFLKNRIGKLSKP